MPVARVFAKKRMDCKRSYFKASTLAPATTIYNNQIVNRRVGPASKSGAVEEGEHPTKPSVAYLPERNGTSDYALCDLSEPLRPSSDALTLPASIGLVQSSLHRKN